MNDWMDAAYKGDLDRVIRYHGIHTERLHSSAHPSLIVANTQFSCTILISVKSLLLGTILEPDTYWGHCCTHIYHLERQWI